MLCRHAWLSGATERSPSAPRLNGKPYQPSNARAKVLEMMMAEQLLS
jgi:hypothetical protein